MIYARPSTTFEARCEGFATGLAGTIGVRLLDNAGGTTTARTTTGITESPTGSGSYVVTITAPADAGQYSVFWDTGVVSPTTTASEDLIVTANATIPLATDNLYVTAAALKESLSLTGTSYADADINNVLAAASRGIDRACGRHFYNQTETRYYWPRDEWLIEIEDLAAEPTTLQTDPAGDGSFPYTWTLHTDYELEPYNVATDGFPYTHIRRRRRGSFYFPCTVERSVKITGTFGWAAVPSEIVTATSLLAFRLLERTREAPLGVVTLGPDLVGRIARTDPDVSALIAEYIRHDVLVGA